jgi:TRAP-type transport system small permease protein
MRFLDVEDIIGTVVLAAIFIVMIAAVFARYVLNDSIVWSEELARLGLVAITFIGIGAGFRHRSHVRIDLSAAFGPRLASVLGYIGTAVTLLFLLMLAYNGIILARTLRTAHTAALQMPLSWLYLFVGLAALLGAVRVIQAAIVDFRRSN